MSKLDTNPNNFYLPIIKDKTKTLYKGSNKFYKNFGIFKLLTFFKSTSFYVNFYYNVIFKVKKIL